MSGSQNYRVRKENFWQGINFSQCWDSQPDRNSPNHISTEDEICWRESLGFVFLALEKQIIKALRSPMQDFCMNISGETD